MIERKNNKGRGAQYNAPNKFQQQEYGSFHPEGLDEEMDTNQKTEVLFETAKTIVNKVNSPDIGPSFSLNPYQGCEHGCVYCYARNTHEYWGYSAGLDFEQKIIVKRNAVSLLETFFQKYKGDVKPIMLSGNTDCYQPVENKFKITRELLSCFLKHKYPVGIITKNALIVRDLDILKQLAALNLVRVNISITTLDEDLRSNLEPRTATSKKRLATVKELSEAGIPVNIMIAPVIPGLNDHELPAIMEASSNVGALSANYTIVRLNGAVSSLFEAWIHKTYPNKADKVLNQIAECHGGDLQESKFGTRMHGEGKLAEHIARLYNVAHNRFFINKQLGSMDCTQFVNINKGQLGIFK